MEACVAVQPNVQTHASACAAVKLGTLMSKNLCEGAQELPPAQQGQGGAIPPQAAVLPAGTCQYDRQNNFKQGDAAGKRTMLLVFPPAVAPIGDPAANLLEWVASEKRRNARHRIKLSAVQRLYNAEAVVSGCVQILTAPFSPFVCDSRP